MNDRQTLNSTLPVTVISLGSNGFHLLSAIRKGNSLEQTAHLHENVQVESHMDENGAISDIGVQRILDAIGRFSSHLQDNPQGIVGAIATASFRRANNSDSIIEQVSERLGYPVKVLSGQEEGLLCYLGIASSKGLSDHNRLVIDIGGGSTELMIAYQNRLVEFCSVDLGCVSLTKRVFKNGNISSQNLDEATSIAARILQPVVNSFLNHGWVEVMGCGGTISSIFAILQTRRLGGRFITTAGLEKFSEAVLEAGSAESLGKSIVDSSRIELLPAGLAILRAIYQQLGVEKTMPVFSSVGQGLLVDLARRRYLSGASGIQGNS